MKEIYILVTDWVSDFDNNLKVKAYSTRERAKAAYDLEVKTEKLTDSLYKDCFDSKGNFIKDNNERVCCDEFNTKNGESFWVYHDGSYAQDHFTIYYKKITLDV